MVSGKKVALWGCLGCGGFVLLLVLLFAGGAGLIAYQGYRFGKGIEQAYREVATGYKTLEEQYSYEPPADGILGEERLQTFLRIRQEISVFLRERADKVEETGQKIEEQMESPGVISKIRGIGTIKEIVNLAANLAADVGHEHIRLLTSEDMSAKEYQWFTLTYLGTLVKGADEGAADLSDRWQGYLEAFESARKKTRDIQMNFGRTNIRGGDMNRENLTRALEKAVYNPQNVELVKTTLDRLVPNEGVATVDFIALHLDRIIAEMTRQG